MCPYPLSFPSKKALDLRPHERIESATQSNYIPNGCRFGPAI
jgi:hypothetical protein